MSSHRKLKALRRRFRPANVRLVFIGESPPASGRFFYKADSGLYRAVRAAFRALIAPLMVGMISRSTRMGTFMAQLYLPQKLRQTVKSQIQRMENLTQGNISKKVRKGNETGRDPTPGTGLIGC